MGGQVHAEPPYSVSAPPSQRLPVFTTLEALQISLFGGFYGSSIMQARLIKSIAVNH